MTKKKLIFNEKTHTYRVGKKKLTPVTSFLSRFFPKFDAREVARKLARIPKNKAEKKGVRYWLAQWKTDSEHGTRVHNALEQYIKGANKSSLFDLLEERDFGKVTNGVVWLDLNTNKKHPLETELRVFDEELGLAGTIDLLITNEDGSVTLLDWKTNKEIKQVGYKNQKAYKPIENLEDCNYNKYKLQLSTYAYILERKGYKIKNLILLHLKDNVMVKYDIDYDKETVEKLLNYKEEDENEQDN